MRGLKRIFLWQQSYFFLIEKFTFEDYLNFKKNDNEKNNSKRNTSYIGFSV